ncbi:uncharacterized protein CDAR_422811 [Caerostris darwini]|uniref:Uncharacterized protein n=1 Tax=Caerostris darwini TaxID=1538125 RepID=A0AAV4W528_9ARAC|nr:uncharacterized protein CDAR_422811 [Caerostris darwini]
MTRKGKRFTTEQLEFISQKVSTLKNTDEMSLLVYLILKTKLKIKDLLGWFNTDLDKRRVYLQEHNTSLLEDYTSVPKLFPKTHHAYLLQWKQACKLWLNVEGASFEMLKRCTMNAVTPQMDDENMQTDEQPERE